MPDEKPPLDRALDLFVYAPVGMALYVRAMFPSMMGIFVSRGNETVTGSDPVAKLKDPQALAASDPRILTSVIGPNEIHLYESKEHHANWLDCIRSRRQTIAPVEVAHRACSACLIHHIAMKLKRKLYWDPQRERFRNDDEANAMLSRPQRPPYALT